MYDGVELEPAARHQGAQEDNPRHIGMMTWLMRPCGRRAPMQKFSHTVMHPPCGHMVMRQCSHAVIMILTWYHTGAHAARPLDEASTPASARRKESDEGPHVSKGSTTIATEAPSAAESPRRQSTPCTAVSAPHDEEEGPLISR